MKLPVNIGALMQEATNVQAAASTPIALTVFMSMDAPAELVARMRSSFATSAANVRLTMDYLDDRFDAMRCANDDLAVVVAGMDDLAGLAASALRAVGTPALVVAPAGFTATGEAAVPDGDLVLVSDYTDDALKAVEDRMGEWIIEIFKDKRLAFSVAFPFVAHPMAVEAMRATAAQNAGIAVVDFLPGADMALLTLNQGKMVLQIAAAYGQEMSKDRIYELAAVVGGGFLFRTIGRNAAGVVPVLGWAVKGLVGYTGTIAMGVAAIEYFENGGGPAGLGAALGQASSKIIAWAKQVKDYAKQPDHSIVSLVREKL